MGARYLERSIHAKNRTELSEEFQRMKDKARAYYGSNPYSGSWATIHGFTIVPDPFPEMPGWAPEKMRAISEWLCETTDKGDAQAIKMESSYFIAAWAPE